MFAHRMVALIAAAGLVHGSVVANVVCLAPVADATSAHAGHVAGDAMPMDHVPAAPGHDSSSRHGQSRHGDCCGAMVTCSAGMIGSTSSDRAHAAPVCGVIAGAPERAPRSVHRPPDPPPPKS